MHLRWPMLNRLFAAFGGAAAICVAAAPVMAQYTMNRPATLRPRGETVEQVAMVPSSGHVTTMNSAAPAQRVSAPVQRTSAPNGQYMARRMNRNSGMVYEGSAETLPTPTPAPMATEGEMIFEGQGAVMDDGYGYGMDGCSNGSCSNGSCGGGCGGGRCGMCPPGQTQMVCMPCGCMNWENFTGFAGVEGFKNSGNRGLDGSFGFQEGFNYAIPVPCYPFFGMQFGMRATQSNLDGASFTDSTRDQLFMTGGLFHRTECGLQGGVAFDYMNDMWYYDLKLTQLRGEISWLNPHGHEVGFSFAVSTDRMEDVVSPVGGTFETDSWETNNQYLVFYRMQLPSCDPCCETGEVRFFGGVATSNSGEDGSDGIFGADFNVALSERFSVMTGFTYLVPSQPADGVGWEGGVNNESWNISLALVYHPKCNARDRRFNMYRPLFNVADNGSMILNRYAD